MSEPILQHEQKYSRKDIFQIISEIEKKYELLSRRTKSGVGYWKLIRFAVFEQIVKKLGLSESVPKEKLPQRRNLRDTIIENLNSCLLRKRPAENIIIESPRKIRYGSRVLDPYTYFLGDELATSGKSFLLLENRSFGHMDKSLTNREYFGHSIFETKIERAARSEGTPLDSDNLRLIDQVNQELAREFAVPLRLNIEAAILRFVVQKRVFSEVFRRRRCQRVSLVCSYGKEGIIDAARDCGLESVELQHGTIYKYHPGYSFSQRDVPYLPDKLWIFGQKWYDSFVPIGPNNVKVIGYRFLNEAVERFRHAEKLNRVIIISQWALRTSLLHCAIALKTRKPELDVCYKLHPRESDSLLMEYREKYPHIDFVKDEVSIHELFASSKWAVGVFSTAVFEAAAFDCCPILLDAPGIENMQDFVSEMKIPVFASPEELVDAFEKVSALRPDRERLKAWFEGLPSY